MSGKAARLTLLEAQRRSKEAARPPRRIQPGVWPELAVWLRFDRAEKVRAFPGLAARVERELRAIADGGSA
ncbi:hypothetical protein [Deinococcus sp.]|uniref:hypothetical protein n=1 Tax=Deinococcus sp. TaxID=47478 RepID=UPI0025EF79B4|nr:hypothetical protein [Deinococcus sp.]